MRFRKGYLPFVALLGAWLVLPPAAANSVETTPVIEAIYPRWSPEQEAIKPTKTIDFVNANGIPHGIRWTGGPASLPKCTGVPINSSSSSWSGSCTFEEEGTYTFECTVHPVMKGTIYVNATGTIPPPPPTATTESASSVTETSATLKGTVNPNGEATEYFFEYGTSTSYGHKTEPAKTLTAGTVGGQTVSEAVTGLTQGTTYHFRVVAKNPSGTAHGADETFTTTSPPPPPGAPVATTEAATSVTETGATLKGMVNPDGETTEYVFNYGTSTSYGQHSTELALAATDHTSHSVSAVLTGLTPGTTYHFQLVAKNNAGTSKGADMTFTTTSPPPPPKEEPPPSGGTATTPPPVIASLPKPEETLATMAPPFVAGSLKLAAPSRGASVRGSIQVSPFGAGGRLEVDLLANSASLARRRHSKPVVVGRLVRVSVPGGKVSFSVGLNARGKSALRRHRRLTLTVKVTLVPPRGAAASATKAVVLHA